MSSQKIFIADSRGREVASIKISLGSLTRTENFSTQPIVVADRNGKPVTEIRYTKLTDRLTRRPL